jgi:hypothetical protein
LIMQYGDGGASKWNGTSMSGEIRLPTHG